ncbi:MAG: type II secretion system F family protein [Planctomycetota bacterium]|jgi:type II secretory pathway component PulF
MAGSRRIPDVVLADILHRLSIAVGAGIDLRRAWASEAGRVPGRWRPALERVAARLGAGDGLGEACAATGVMPDVVAGMLLVGDRTGRLAEVLAETAKTLSRSIATRRTLRAALVGPAIRLVVAVLAIVVMIIVSGFARGLDGAPLDFLGLGLAGQRGVTLFLSGLAATVVALAVVGVAARNSWRRRGWAWSVGRHLPLIGPAAVTAAAAAWCRAASLAAHAGVSVGEMVQLATLAAPGFGCERHRVEDLLRSGRDLPEALAATGRLPRPVIEAVAVGEATGTTAEALDRVADHLDETAARGFAAAVQAAGFLTWSLVACLVATLVIRVAATYARMIHDAARLP